MSQRLLDKRHALILNIDSADKFYQGIRTETKPIEGSNKMSSFTLVIYTITAFMSLFFGATHPDTDLDIKFAGALEFSDDGTLFVGDNYNGAIYAFEMPAGDAISKVAPVSIVDIDTKIANLLGVAPNALEINDMIVHPTSHEVYISLSRIGNFVSQPAIVKVTQSSTIELLDLSSFAFKKQELVHYPDQETTFQVRSMGPQPSPRDRSKGAVKLSSLAIMDMVYHEGELFVSGVAHDNFLSTLRRISYPFDGTQGITNVDMYHIAHDQYETRAPIRAMSIQQIDGKAQLIAAYTCSPLVLVPLEDLVDGAKISANTIADIGNGQPLDMIPFKLNGQDLLFVTNDSRSPQVIPVRGLDNAQVVTHEDFERGPKLDLHPLMPFGPIGKTVMFDGVSLHMDLLSEDLFVSLTRDVYTGNLNLDTNPTFFPNSIHNMFAEFDFPQYHAEKSNANN